MKIDLKSKAPTPAAAFMDMMGGKPESGILQLSINNLRPFSSAKYPVQPFRQYSQQKLAELADSISANGLLSPIIVRPMPAEGTYQILAGHNRTAAAKLAGLTTIPCIVREVDDDIAIMILTDTNLNQRDNLLYSEKAFAYKMQVDALKSQGKRTDLLNTSGTMCQKSNARDLVASQNGESSRNIQNYIRLTFLLKPLLDLVDSENIPFRAGVNISYLTEDQQQVLYDYCAANETRINLRYSEQIKALADRDDFSEQTLDELFQAKERRPPRSIRLPMKSIRQYFDGMDDQEITRKVIEIIRHHYAAG